MSHSAQYLSHEDYIKRVAQLAIQRLENSPELKAKAEKAKLVYGAGNPGLRGVTYFNRWLDGDSQEAQAFVEVCSFGEESPIQLAGTTIHELAHVIAGPAAGHGKEWKAACELLGLRRVKAAGTRYMAAMIDPTMRTQIAGYAAQLEEARPHNGRNGVSGIDLLGLLATKIKPCSMGIGTRGGKSRGAGSGSRLRKFCCDCTPPIIARVARDEFDATCNICNGPFHRG